MNFLITGATGFIGKRLVKRLTERGDAIGVIGRDAQKISATFGAGVRSFSWQNETEWQAAVRESDAVIHLAGEQINGQRWTPEFKKKVVDSRVATTRAIADARPKVLVSASAVGYYGDRGERVTVESDAPGKDFLADVCVAWEREAVRARENGSRVAVVRIGIVLGKEGGPLQSMLQPPGAPFSPYKLGLGGPLGSGKQWVPWIHVEDLVSMLIWSAENPDVNEAVNGVAPNPVTNAQMSAAIGRVLNRPAIFPVPGFALYALLGDFAYALLYSQRVMPEAAQKRGFAWRYADIESALRDLLMEK